LSEVAPKGVVRTTSSGSKEAWRNVYRFQLFPYLSNIYPEPVLVNVRGLA
jgi:hypothetical protein